MSINKDKLMLYIDNLELSDEEKNEIVLYTESLIENFENFSQSLNTLKNNQEFSKSLIDIIKTLTKEHADVKRDT